MRSAVRICLAAPKALNLRIRGFFLFVFGGFLPEKLKSWFSLKTVRPHPWIAILAEGMRSNLCPEKGVSWTKNRVRNLRRFLMLSWWQKRRRECLMSPSETTIRTSIRWCYASEDEFYRMGEDVYCRIRMLCWEVKAVVLARLPWYNNKDEYALM